MKKILLLSAVVMLSGCQLLSSTVDVAADTILVSTKIDSMQTELGQYSTNQVALNELDVLQSDVFETLTTGEGAENIFSYQARGKIIYNTLTAEVLQNWDSLTPEQQAVLIAIDNELISLNESIDSMVSSTGVSNELITMMNQAVTLMLYYKAI